jgi:hypothetical protein
MTIHAVAVATPKIVGKALYLELIADDTIPEDERRQLLGWRHGGTKQIIVFPQYQDDTGAVSEAVVMSRIVSEHAPRSQWDTSFLRDKPKPMSTIEPDESPYGSYQTIPTYNTAEWLETTEQEKHDSRKLALDFMLRRELIDTLNVFTGEGDSAVRSTVAKQGWKVREGKPISVEITDQDYAEVLSHKTPQAVIRRINKVRGTLDKFPTKLA